MRNIERIKPFLSKIECIWMANQDLRFGQIIEIIHHITGESDIFHLEDDIIGLSLDKLIKDKQLDCENIKELGNVDIAEKRYKTWEILKLMDEDYGDMEGRRFKLINNCNNSDMNVGMEIIVSKNANGDVGLFSSDIRLREIVGLEEWIEIEDALTFHEVVEMLYQELDEFRYFRFEYGEVDVAGTFDIILKHLAEQYSDINLAKALQVGNWYLLEG